MATKSIVTSVVFTLADGTTTVTVTDNASKAYGDFTHGLPITDDSGTTYPYHAILSALPAFEEQEVDMTDNSCGEGGGGGDVIFTWEGIPVTADMLTCFENEGEYAAAAIIPNVSLKSGSYTLTVHGHPMTKKASGDLVAFGGQRYVAQNAVETTEIAFIISEGFETCESAKEHFMLEMAGATVTFSDEPGPK